MSNHQIKAVKITKIKEYFSRKLLEYPCIYKTVLRVNNSINKEAIIGQGLGSTR